VADKVLFLVHKDGDSPVFAAFPHYVGTMDPHTMTSYEHVGQHGCVHMAYIAECRPATSEEYKDLAAELVRIGYDLNIQTRTGQRDFERRVRELEAMAA
jgi:hypothetical protein